MSDSQSNDMPVLDGLPETRQMRRLREKRVAPAETQSAQQVAAPPAAEAVAQQAAQPNELRADEAPDIGFDLDFGDEPEAKAAASEKQPEAKEQNQGNASAFAELIDKALQYDSLASQLAQLQRENEQLKRAAQPEVPIDLSEEEKLALGGEEAVKVLAKTVSQMSAAQQNKLQEIIDKMVEQRVSKIREDAVQVARQEFDARVQAAKKAAQQKKFERTVQQAAREFGRDWQKLAASPEFRNYLTQNTVDALALKQVFASRDPGKETEDVVKNVLARFMATQQNQRFAAPVMPYGGRVPSVGNNDANDQYTQLVRKAVRGGMLPHEVRKAMQQLRETRVLN